MLQALHGAGMGNWKKRLPAAPSGHDSESTAQPKTNQLITSVLMSTTWKLENSSKLLYLTNTARLNC